MSNKARALVALLALLVAVPAIAQNVKQASWRAVATGTQFPNAKSTTFKQTMSRSRHQAMTTIVNPKLILANFFGVNPEAGLGGTTTATAAIEYQGKFYQVTNGGNPSMQIADNTFLITDAANLTITAGDFFFVRLFFTSATGITFVTYASGAQGMDTNNGEAMTFAVTGLTDQTMGGTVVNTSVLSMVRPAAIIAVSSVPAVMIFGDSRAFGHSDGYLGTTTTGEIARGVGLRFPYILSAQDGGSISNWVTRANANQVAISKYATHVINQFGVNDIYAGSRTLAQLTADCILFASYFPGLPIFKTTIGPETTSSDSWATIANQTAVSGNTVRLSFNDMIRITNIPGYAGIFDIADTYETSRDSGFYVVNGTANYATVDGIHQTSTMNTLIANDDLFRQALIH